MLYAQVDYETLRLGLQMLKSLGIVAVDVSVYAVIETGEFLKVGKTNVGEVVLTAVQGTSTPGAYTTDLQVLSNLVENVPAYVTTIGVLLTATTVGVTFSGNSVTVTYTNT